MQRLHAACNRAEFRGPIVGLMERDQHQLREADLHVFLDASLECLEIRGDEQVRIDLG